MNTKEFSELFAKKCGIPKGRAEDYCRSFTELLSECFDSMESGDRLTFYGFGTFVKKHIPAHLAGDMKNGGVLELPAKDRVVFTRSKSAQ